MDETSHARSSRRAGEADPKVDPEVVPDLGRFIYEQELGRGGTGVVYLCRDPDLGRRVAVKVLAKAQPRDGVSSSSSEGASGNEKSDEAHLARLRSEARMLASINHPNIATIFSIEETSAGTHLLVLEYVEGETLATRLRRGRLDVAESIRTALQIARAIAAAHSKEIIHRDIKPSNVVLTPTGDVKVLDFGLSRNMRGSSTQDHEYSAMVGSDTRRRLVGTVGFMSPEQARGRPVDRRTDIWSFGCILYYMLAGKSAFPGTSHREILAATLRREPDWMLLHPDTPDAVRDLLFQCLEKDAIARLDDIGCVVAVLDRLARSLDPVAHADLPSPEPLRKMNGSQGLGPDPAKPRTAARRRPEKVDSNPPAPKRPPTGSEVVLFTAFEPSGDSHAAPVIAELRRRAPHLTVYAWGGPKMEAAGATLIERTVEGAAMGLNALTKVARFRSYVRSIKRWARQCRVVAHVAVDSPAANFPICKVMRRHGARVIHLVAPQVWAWGGWRVRKLRRLTSMVLCVLPFEEQWFRDREVPARFIGHFAMNRTWDEESIREVARGLPSGAPRMAIFPGSRKHEVQANLGLLVNAFTELQGRHQGLTGVIIAANEEIAQFIKRKVKVFPVGLHLSRTSAEAAIMWCDLALAVSGTISLDIARQHKPMVAVYKTGPLGWLGSKILLRSQYRLLPNIVAGREIAPEFIPHLGGAGPIIEECSRLLNDSKNAARQSEGLRRVALRFSNKRPAQEAASVILQVIKKG